MVPETEASSAAIVTTLRDADEVLQSFVQYHLGIGFEHLYLFFDAPRTTIPKFILGHPNITAIPRDNALHHAWATTHSYTIPKISRHISTEVMARQILNAEIALRKAYRAEINWLLHIDIDELFYLPKGSVKEHFADLASRSIDCVQYANLEAIPEQRDVGDYFREATLFKINPTLDNNAGLIQKYSNELHQIPQIPPAFFHYYVEGKAAVRVGPSTLPKGVHNFSTPPAGKRLVPHEDAVILHYPCCGFQHFKQKYVTLGNFDNQWFGKDSNITIQVQSHLDARDVIQTQDAAQIEAYYVNQRLISDEELVRWLLNAGLANRIAGPAQFIQANASNDHAES